MSFTQAELEERRHYLGASESAAALGLSNFFTPLQLYQSKIGEGEPIEETLPMMVGTALEPVILRMFEKETGMTVTDRQKRVVDPHWERRRATLDGVSSDGGIVQAKASGMYGWWGKESDAVPQSIVYQVHHEMACTGAKLAYVPVILGQRTFQLYQIDRDEELIELLTAGEREFMARVDSRMPPPALDSDDLKILYPEDVGISVVASVEIEPVAYQLAKLKADRKALEKQEEDAAFAVKSFMKDAAILKDAKGNTLYTYKSHTTKRLSVTTIRKERPDIAAQYEEESTVRTLLCKIE